MVGGGFWLTEITTRRMNGGRGVIRVILILVARILGFEIISFGKSSKGFHMI